MGAWDGTKLGLKVIRPDDRRLAEQLLYCLGVNLESGICEEVGELSGIYKPNIEGEVENDLLGIISLLDEHISEYVNQFYPEYDEDEDDEYDGDEDDTEEDSEDEDDENFDFQLDDLFHLINRLFAPAYVYLAHEEGNNTSDDYYRYEAILDPFTGEKTELNCFYSYGDGINLYGGNPKTDATESNKECIAVRKLDEKVIDWLIGKAEENEYEDLAQLLKNYRNSYSNVCSGASEAEELKAFIFSRGQAHYLKLKETYLQLLQTIPFHCGSRDYYAKTICCSDSYVSRFDPLPGNVVTSWGNFGSYPFDYLIVDDQICGTDEMRTSEIESKADWLVWALQRLPLRIKQAEESGALFVKKSDYLDDLEKDKAAGYPSIQKAISKWKATIPFDHVSTVSCEGKNIATVELSDNWIYNYLKIDRNILWDLYPTRNWIVEKLGNVQSNVTRACDYLVVGLDATPETSKVAQAIRYRDSGKSNIKIIPEDEFLRMLNGEVLEISEEDQQAMQARRDALLKAEEEKLQAAKEKQRLVEEEKQRKAERQQATWEAKQAAREAKQKADAELAEQRRQERMEAREAAQQQKEAEQAAEKAAKAEQRRLQEEERARTLFDNVVYMPGEEPENIRKRINNLFAKLDEAYPNKQISRLQSDHKKWAETVTDLYRLLGYPDGRAFLETYGYTVLAVENKGGRPSHDVNAAIEELKRRYPNGGGKNAAQLKKDNSDLPIKTLINNAQKLFGMPLKDYLTQIGVLP